MAPFTVIQVAGFTGVKIGCDIMINLSIDVSVLEIGRRGRLQVLIWGWLQHEKEEKKRGKIRDKFLKFQELAEYNR